MTLYYPKGRGVFVRQHYPAPRSEAGMAAGLMLTRTALAAACCILILQSVTAQRTPRGEHGSRPRRRTGGVRGYDVGGNPMAGFLPGNQTGADAHLSLLIMITFCSAV